MAKKHAPVAMATAMPSPPITVSPGYLMSMRKLSLKSSAEEPNTDFLRASGVFPPPCACSCSRAETRAVFRRAVTQ